MSPKTKKCPSCKNQVPEDARACAFCPYSFPDEEDIGIEQVGQQQSWSPLPLVLGLAAIGIIGAMYFTMSKGGENLTEGMTNLQRARAEAAGQATPGRQVDPDAKALLQKLSNQGAVEVVTAPKEAGEAPMAEAEEPSQGVFITHSPDQKPAAVVKEWRMRGVVYDLKTLAPIPKCRMVFSDEQANARFETMADAAGRYRMILPPLDGRGYSVTMRQPGYAASYLNPGMENVRGLSPQERWQMSQDLSGSVMTPYTVEPNSGDPLITDFYLAPTR